MMPPHVTKEKKVKDGPLINIVARGDVLSIQIVALNTKRKEQEINEEGYHCTVTLSPITAWMSFEVIFTKKMIQHKK